MGSVELGVNFQTNGFKPSEIRPRKMWNRLKEDFVNMYNDYCEATNAVIPQLNKAWEEAHPETNEENSEVADDVKDLQDRISDLEYGCYMRDAFDTAAYLVNQKHPDSYLDGFVFMDGAIPVFAARIKQHPELSMTFVVESK
jgi:hypothetical protein